MRMGQSSVVTDAEKDKLANRCRIDLKFLCYVLGMRDWSANKELHTAIARHIWKPSKFKLFLLPRDHLKSSIITKAGAVQKVLNNPNIRILIANNTWDNARKFLRSIQRYLDDTSLLAQWCGRFVSPNWNQDEIVVKKRTLILDSPTIATT